MANTYELIASVTIGAGGASTIDFTSIPSTYTDLICKVSGRTSGTNTGYKVNFNNLTSNLSSKLLYGTGSAAASGSEAAKMDDYAGVTQSTYTSNTFSNAEFYIPNYAGSNNKSVSLDGVTENNATAALSNLSAGLWANSSAINQITITPENGSFVQYSTAYLYGVKNA